MVTYLKVLLFFIILLLCKCECYYTNRKHVDWSDLLLSKKSVLPHQTLSGGSLSSRRQLFGPDFDYYLYMTPNRDIDEELRRLNAEPPSGLPNVMRYG
ncbi:unnamed protein product [Heterobilharzia americana]|nr:unnamed protein product [Heterobilharzia americana]CAH8505284.1 unnamed protein product [Heterobilharzia americana]